MDLTVCLFSFLHFLKFKLSGNSFTKSFLCYVLSVYLPFSRIALFSQAEGLVEISCSVVMCEKVTTSGEIYVSFC